MIKLHPPQKAMQFVLRLELWRFSSTQFS